MGTSSGRETTTTPTPPLGRGIKYGSPEHARAIYWNIQHNGVSSNVQHYICGHCGTSVSGWIIVDTQYQRRWLLCPQCGRGSVQNDDVILPPPQTFDDIGGLPDIISVIYDEARASFGAQAYTGCEMLCRKILMNAAVDKGANKNMKFVEYVDHLNDNYCVTQSLKDMATTIKDNGNDAAHEINPPDPERAEHTLKFTKRILDIMYGAEHELGEYGSAHAGQADTAK